MRSWGRSSHTTPLLCAKAFGGELKQLRYCFDIPVGEADLDVAEVGGELRYLSPHVGCSSIPLEKSLGCEGMAKILKPWSASDASTGRGFAQTDGARQPRERATGSTVLKARALLGDQKGMSTMPRAKLVALPGIEREGCTRGVLYGNKARLSELRLPDGQDALLKIHIGHIERQRLPGPQSGRGQQPDERHKGSRPQSGGRVQPRRRGHKLLNLLVGEDVRLLAPVADLEKPAWWDLRSWIEQA